MRLFLSISLLLGFIGVSSEPPSASGTVALVGGTVYRSPDALPISDGTVLIEGAKIAAVGPRASVRVPDGATVVDCTGTFVVAGFQNSHVHFTEPKWSGAAEIAAATLDAQLTDMLTSRGFTTVVDTASTLADTTAIRRRIEAGEVAGPRILTAGAPLFPKDGIPYYVKTNLPPEVAAHWPTADSPEKAVEMVQANVDGGADIIKLFTGSWITRERVLPMPLDVATAAAAAAHRRGRLVFSHASNLAGLEVAIAAHVDVIAHALDDPRGLTADHLRRMHDQGMSLIPTLTLFGSDTAAPAILAEVRDYARRGGQILFGTDVGYTQIYDPTREYELMARAGLTWRDILASLTTNPATRFGETERHGRIITGSDADLVVLSRDPSTDRTAFAAVRDSIRAGRTIYSARVRH